MDKELRRVVAGGKAARLVPDKLTAARDVIKMLAANGDGVERRQEAEADEFLYRVRLQGEADAEFAEHRRLLINLAVDPATVKEQRSAKAAHPRANDCSFHEFPLRQKV
jgi:hypothetical protein